MRRWILVLSILLSAGNLRAQKIENVCYKESTSANFKLGGSLDFSVGDAGRLEFNLDIYRPTIRVESVHLLYGVDRMLDRFPTQREYDKLKFSLRAPVKLVVDGDESYADFEMRRDFDDFGLLFALRSPPIGGLRSCGVLFFVGVHSRSIRMKSEGELDF